jgi:hypothetical protein
VVGFPLGARHRERLARNGRIIGAWPALAAGFA